MNRQIDEIIARAQGYIGIRENPPGTNNVIFNTRYYGREVSGGQFPWCCAFIWCLFQDIGAPELFFGGDKTASCTALMNYGKHNRLFHVTDFRRGDLALMDFDGNDATAEHIGIIEDVSPGAITAIEGNTSSASDTNGGEVQRRIRRYSQIAGVYRPCYKTEDDEMEKRYNTLDELPDWARNTVTKLTAKGIIKGTAANASGSPEGLNLSEDMLRLLVFNDRAGLY